MTHLFCSPEFVPLNLPHLFLFSPQPPLHWKPPVCSLYLWLFVLFCLLICFIFGLHISVKSYSIFLSLSELISLNIIPSRAFHVVSNWQGYILFMADMYIYIFMHIYKIYHCSSAGKESTCNAGDLGSIPGSGRSPGERIGYPLQYSWASPVAQTVKNLPAMQEIWVQSLG